MEWRGAALLPLYLYVCRDCYDVPQEQLRAIVVPADPLPIIQPRVEPFAADETTLMALAPPTIDPVTGIPIPNPVPMTTIPGEGMTPSPYGFPLGWDPNAIMPLQIVDGVPVHYGEPVPFLAINANGSDQIAVTCSAPHGLSTGNQISVLGLSNQAAEGFYSVTVSTATAFSYQTYELSVPAGSLLTSDTVMLTCRIGNARLYTLLQQQYQGAL